MFGATWTPADTSSLTFNGGELSDAMAVPMSMNNGAIPGRGQTIVGLFMDMKNQQHGYRVQNRMLESYDPTTTATLTAIWDINPSGDFVGTYREAGEVAPKRHGFVQLSDGFAPIILDFVCQEPTGCAGAPFGTAAFSTVAFGINPDGVVVGQYVLTNGGVPHGFIALPPDKN